MTEEEKYKLANDAGFKGQFMDWLQLSPDEKAKFLPVNRPFLKEAEALTSERRNAHGDWLKQAKLANQLKSLMRRAPNWSTLEAHQAEALDMIAVKMSRILSGDAGHEDHWDDIGGYALLGKGGHQ